MKTMLPLFISCCLSVFSLRAQTTPISTDDMERLITKEEVITLVAMTCDAIAKDALVTIEKINKGESPFVDSKNPTLYAFVYTPDVVLIGHPKAVLVGKCMKGKPDAKGKMFRDEIVTRAVAEGNGWVEYLYQKPGEENISKKSTRFKKVVGSDGRSYIVCAGMYAGK